MCLCFSLNDRASFNNLVMWLDELRNFDVQGQVYLVGCKSDLDIEVPTDEILNFAEAAQVGYIQTSAKDAEGVSDGFRKIVEETVQANLINLAYNREGPKAAMIEKLPAEPKKRCCGA